MRLCWTLPFLLLLEGALVCSAGMQAWAGDLTSERKAELRNLSSCRTAARATG